MRIQGRNITLTTIVMILCVGYSFSQTKSIIGSIMDTDSITPVPYASLYIKELDKRSSHRSCWEI